MIVVDRFESLICNQHVLSSDWIFPLVLTDNDFRPQKLLQTCFAFTNAPVLLTAAHYSDLFGELVPNEKGQVHLPRNLSEKVAFSAVLRLNPDKTHFYLYPVATCCFGSAFDLAVLLIDNSFPITPSIPINEMPLMGANVSSIGFPTQLQRADFSETGSSICSRVAFSDGKILAIHSSGYRKCWYPTIESDTWVSGGMSGGPLVLKNPTELIGVNSISFDMPQGPSQATWLGKAMDHGFSFNAKIQYADNTEFNLREFTIRTLWKFAHSREGLEHRLAQA